MKIGVADYGMNVWYGGCFDYERRLTDLREIGYDGVERLEAISPSDAMAKATLFRKLGADFGTCRGPDIQSGLQWTAALGKSYVWLTISCKRMDDRETYYRRLNDFQTVAASYGLRVGVHNHLGQLAQFQHEVEEILERCPKCDLIFDTAHLAAAGGDCLAIAQKYASRIAALHLKDYLLLDNSVDLSEYGKRGRFCELGAGNIGMDNAAILKTLVKKGYAGWVFVEHDTHLRDPLADLKVSRDYLRAAGF